MPQPYWAFLYSQFLKQADTAKMKAGLEQVESAMFVRLQELDGLPESNIERLAIENAGRKLLEIKTTRLGFPLVPVKVRRHAYRAFAVR